jgi:hypothetical protein
VLSGSAATWTASSSTLTEASAFTGYTFLAGDEIQIQGGTGATTGVYKILSRTSANAIVLDGSLSGSDLATGDIEWRIDPQTITLPEDLRDITWISSTNNAAVGGVTLVTPQEIIEKRRSSASITASTGLYYAAVVFSGEPLKPILEIYPSANANTTGAMRIFYRSRWADITTDSTQVHVPTWIRDLFVFIVRAYAAGYVRNDMASIHQRLDEIRNGPIFEFAVRSDGMVQPFHGLTRNGGPTMWRNTRNAFAQVANRIPNPEII